jgi:hypothetical protein
VVEGGSTASRDGCAFGSRIRSPLRGAHFGRSRAVWLMSRRIQNRRVLDDYQAFRIQPNTTTPYFKVIYARFVTVRGVRSALPINPATL